jgi:hypothetical protein
MAARVHPHPATEDVARKLDAFIGIPEDKIDAAEELMARLAKDNNGTVPFGIWHGGCYYKKIKKTAQEKQGKHGTYECTECMV